MSVLVCGWSLNRWWFEGWGSPRRAGVGMCARQRSNFSLRAQRKVTKRKGSRRHGPYGVPCAARCRWGLAKLALRAQTTPALIHLPLCCSAASGRRGTGYRYQDKFNTKNKTPQGRAMARPCRIGIGCFGCPSRRNEEASSAEPGGSGAQMFEPEGRVSAHPAWIEQRSVPAGPTNPARLLFAYFLLAKQEKVRRPPGRNPASQRQRQHTGRAPST